MQPDPTSDTIRIVRKSPTKPQEDIGFHQKAGLDFCFLMDITQSMQNYVDGTLKSLKELIKMIQSMLQQQVKIGFFGYRDFEKENPGEQQFDFIDFGLYTAQDIEKSPLYSKINSIQCSGGGDFAEDIRGAILKSVEVMNWTGRQKYLILIADAPAHGTKYSGKYGDNYPDATPLDDALDLLIQKDIRLIILEISEYTKLMVNEIRAYYEMKRRENFVEINELKAEQINDIANKLAGCLCDTIKRNIQRDTVKKQNF